MAAPGGRGWLSVPNPRGLLDRTAALVLNATHGSRTLLPTSDVGAEAGDTQVGGIEDAAQWDGREEDEEEEEEQGEAWRRESRVVPEREVLRGRWNRWAVAAAEGGTGLVRIERMQRVARARARAGRVRFVGLPGRVVAGVLERLAVDELLAVVNSCRAVRRVVCRREPGAADVDAGVGARAYTALGLQLWRALLRRMGWRIREERAPGHEPRLRVAAPRSHAALLERISGVADQDELAALVASEPDLVFKALYDDMRRDLCAMRAGDRALPPVVAAAAAAAGDARAVAERLDQLLWFGRAGLCRGAPAACRRLAAAADRLEDAYRGRFTAALAAADTDAMRAAAHVLARLREGRGCIGILAEAHPLFHDGSGAAPPDARCAAVRRAAAAACDAPSFAAFLAGVQALVAELAHIADRALPPGWMRTEAVCCFVEAVLAPGGPGCLAVHRACDRARPDSAFLPTVAAVAAQLLAAADEWARLDAVPRARGRRCVFGALAAVAPEYVARELRAVEARYAAAVAQWAAKDAAPDPREATRADFARNQQQMDEYRARVLNVLSARLDSPAADGADTTTAPHRTVVGDVMSASISVDLCLNMLLSNRDTVARLAVFAAAPPDMRQRTLALDAIESVFCAFLKSAGNHIRPALSRAIAELRELEHSASETQRAAPSGDSAQRFAGVWQRFFEVVHLGDLVVQLAEVYHRRELTVFIDEHDFLNAANQERRAFERAVDDGVAVGMDCVIEVILRQTQHILEAAQQPADYHPDTSSSLMLHPTIACTAAVQFLGECAVALRSFSTHKQVRDVVMAEIASRLFHLLLDHIKTFRITEPGGFQLIADLNLYYDWAQANVDPDALRFFAALKDLANCFILAPRDLRAFLRDHYSRRTFDGIMRSEEVYDVVACRADYRDIRTHVEGHCEFM
ncbi:F-box protein: endocytic membrane traffic, recycling ReCYcling 1 [Coemansia javaensis]|uniref:F-box protein: endocytic membrane traffic, recycling ReCYcling 1 n=1 Tax=Coemansia javaensis TaxID=2761396 RepID=A0A9W8HHC7_9FUNG|nr:F-box protein: endocytic membrane traffic, recycling ReCYcling 1 [Coemansia javaensis]